MSSNDIDRIRSLLYLYFDAAEFKLKSRLVSITERILYSSKNISYNEAVKILEIKDKIETVEQISKEIYSLLDGLQPE